MCGIVGIISKTEHRSIDKATQAIAHRGPDDMGVNKFDHVAFGHRRLAIQDLSPNGHQPMFTADKRYCIVFNGEIYNHWEIRENLSPKYTFKSESDTETILYGYLEYGEDIFKMLNGIFALAIYDTLQKDIIIARDHFGVKPLYIYQDGQTFAFASEIKAFKTFDSFDQGIDYQALVNYLYFLYSPAEKTPFSKVKKLLPGHILKFNTDAFLNSNDAIPDAIIFYEIPFNGVYSNATEAELINELDDKLFNAVKRQLLADVPLGFFLSGGLDSSAIVAMAKKAIGQSQRLTCFTIDTGQESNSDGFANDLDYAKMVAKHLDVDLEIVPGSPDLIKDFDTMIYHLDEPQADIAPLHVLNICKEARKKGFVVLLGGTAGDDLFSGYRRHQALDFEKYFKFIPLFFRKIIKRISSSFDGKLANIRRLKKVLSDIDKPKLQRLAGYYGWFNREEIANLLLPNIKNETAYYDPQQILIDSLRNIPKENNDLNKMLFWDMKYFLTDHNLNYTDKLSMAVGVEVRVPFLDVELLEFSTKIPPELKLKGKTTKYLLKKVMERYLPHEVIYRPKTGFGVPLRSWLLNELQDFVKVRILQNNTSIFDTSQLHILLEKNRSGSVDASYTILSILAIKSWINQFTHSKNQKSLD